MERQGALPVGAELGLPPVFSLAGCSAILWQMASEYPCSYRPSMECKFAEEVRTAETKRLKQLAACLSLRLNLVEALAPVASLR